MHQWSEAVELQSVTVRYGAVPALNEVTAHCAAGAVTAVVGPNGSGKSTLLDVIAGVVVPDGGRVRVGRECAYVSQRADIARTLPMTVRDVVAMGRWANGSWWRRATERDRAIVADCMSALDVHRLGGRQWSELSGGQRQRVLVARALAQQSDLLLLDEPSAGLDWAVRETVRDVLAAQVARGTTVVVATHDTDEAFAASHCILLERGGLVAQGPPTDVLDSAAVRAVWRIPAEVGRTRQTARPS